MSEFYSIRHDDLIRLLADHYELNALINAGVDNWEWHDEAIQNDLAEWKKTVNKEELTYEQIAEFNLEQNVRPLPEKAKRISAIDKNFWLEEWA